MILMSNTFSNNIIIVGIDGEIVEHELNLRLRIFPLFCKIYLPAEAGMVVRNMSA
jgi:hypothetical protein